MRSETRDAELRPRPNAPPSRTADFASGLDHKLAFLQSVAAVHSRDSPALSDLQEAREALVSGLGQVEGLLAIAGRRGEQPGRDAAQHLLACGGKRVRPTAVLLVAGCFGPLSDAAQTFAACVELIHSATLLHDDVLDEGELRRGRPAARIVWGNAASVLGGDLLLTEALLLGQRHAPEAVPLLLVALRRLVDGEILQLRARQRLELGREHYESILRDKTGALFRLATEGAGRLGGASESQQSELATFGEEIGFAFQLVDDLLDYAADAETGKSLCADLREGKVTLPLVLAVEREPRLLQAVARVREGEDAEVHTVRRRVIELGCLEPVRQRALGHTHRALGSLATLPSCPQRDLLEHLVRELAARSA